MTNAELGRIIKEARIARRMTQSEVVGDFITRNMLSQIENGNAAPSMRTLQYLMDVLDIHINIEEISEYSSDSDTCITKPAVAESAGIFLSKKDNSSASGSSALISRLMQYKQFFLPKAAMIQYAVTSIIFPQMAIIFFMMNIVPSVPEAATNTQDSLRTAATPVMR
ncbi:DNA-binding helix-turn-helix protein [[Bacteroides] pectinophilus ATCC 43243]|uniref:HTH cro/C1-type domain-containing protein n=1 Tax=[Bacteroides] pectinophilus ATCC 43243 TaxID=483218 RepID=B7ATH3_9FIRM|nr:DNA-binding helix-turn-helix protein [[Bacteroides] pectinophilus ATCC 43243]